MGAWDVPLVWRIHGDSRFDASSFRREGQTRVGRAFIYLFPAAPLLFPSLPPTTSTTTTSPFHRHLLVSSDPSIFFDTFLQSSSAYCLFSRPSSPINTSVSPKPYSITQHLKKFVCPLPASADPLPCPAHLARSHPYNASFLSLPFYGFMFFIDVSSFVTSTLRLFLHHHPTARARAFVLCVCARKLRLYARFPRNILENVQAIHRVSSFSKLSCDRLI